MTEQFLFRNVFNPAVVTQLARQIKTTWPQFSDYEFVQAINPHLEPLSYGARSKLITDALYTFLPKDFPTAADILVRSLGPELEVEELTGFDNFIIVPQCAYISTYGLDSFNVSINALYEMTKRFSAEGDIRPFIIRYPEKTLAVLEKWTQDKNCHVRRLVSEGTRPRLPLGIRLKAFQKDPKPVLALLEELKEDSVLYVRRSVANNLNDIAKDNPDDVVRTLTRWKKSSNKGTQWLVTHALRTLLKQGNKDALEILGYDRHPRVSLKNFSLSPQTVPMGKELSFSFDFVSHGTKKQNLMVDYIIHFMKANGKQAPKVFKLAKKTVEPGERLSLSKSHSFRPIGIRPYYPGVHKLEIMVNGEVMGGGELLLETTHARPQAS